MASRLRRQDGAAATEFAFIAPILILLFFGIVWFGLYIYRAQVLESATREGARVASVGGDVADVRAAVVSAAQTFTPAQLTVDGSSTYCDDADDVATIIVTASGPGLAFTVPFYGTVTPSFGATATFECEQTR